MEGRAHQVEFRSGDAHGVEGVDVEDVEATASIYQHLGEARLADNGVDDERVASRSRDVGRMVPLIEGDRRFRPAEEGGDGRLGGACLPIAYCKENGPLAHLLWILVFDQQNQIGLMNLKVIVL